MSAHDLLRLSRPSWPGTTRDEPAFALGVRWLWRWVSGLYGLAQLVAVHGPQLLLRPMVRLLGASLDARVRAARAAWIPALLAVVGCVLLSASSRSTFGAGGSPLCLALSVALAYGLLGALRWASLGLMAQETRFADYDEAASLLGVGVVGWFRARMRRPEDAVWLRPMAVSSLVHVPMLSCLIIWGATSWFVWCWFVVTMFATFKTSSVNHMTGHSLPFRGFGRTRLERLIGRAASSWYRHVVLFAEGDVPRLTTVSHNLIHHIENNGAADFESTYPYDRTSFFDTSRFYFNCMLCYSFGVEILPYLWRKRSKRAYQRGLRAVVAGLAQTYITLALIAWLIGAGAALLILLVRLLQSGIRYGKMAYASHLFVDPADPTCNFVNSLDMGTVGAVAHGEDVHILHHEHQGHHWSTLQAQRRAALGRYVEHDALAISMDFYLYLQPLVFAKRFDVLAYWMLGPRDVLAYEARAVAPELTPPERTHAERARMAALLERRARPAGWRAPGPVVARIDTLAARFLLWVVGARALQVHMPDLEEL